MLKAFFFCTTTKKYLELLVGGRNRHFKRKAECSHDRAYTFQAGAFLRIHKLLPDTWHLLYYINVKNSIYQESKVKGTSD